MQVLCVSKLMCGVRMCEDIVVYCVHVAYQLIVHTLAARNTTLISSSKYGTNIPGAILISDTDNG